MPARVPSAPRDTPVGRAPVSLKLIGLSPVAVGQLYASLRGLMRDGTTVVLVEQDLTRALAVADRVICMLEGRTVLSAPAAQTTRDEILAAYFGLGAVAP